MKRIILRTIPAILVVLLLASVFSPVASAANFAGSSGAVRYAPTKQYASTSTWPCYAQATGWAGGSSILWGYGSNWCNGEFASTFISMSAWHCAASAGTLCFWWNYAGIMHQSNGLANCKYTYTNYVYCPDIGVASYGGIHKGELWGVQITATTRGLDGQEASATNLYQVQF
ncbi:MAG: hypothetical protein ACRDIV_16760 [Ktedonobacteraceae bacterium]